MIELELLLVAGGSAKWWAYSEKEVGSFLERPALLTPPRYLPRRHENTSSQKFICEDL